MASPTVGVVREFGATTRLKDPAILTHKTSKTYWDNVWVGQSTIPVLYPHSSAIDRQVDRSFDREVRSILSTWGGQPQTLVEVGCGGSCYLPYFARYQGLTVAGLDYSETGCAKAARALAEQGCEGDIRLGNMFSPPADFGPFDLVFSFGLLEHFQDTAVAVKALATLLRPGGLMLSIIPNMTALPGMLQKLSDRRVYDLHVPLGMESFAEAHRQAGMEVLVARPWMTVNFCVVNSWFDTHRFGRWMPYARSGLNQICWATERWLGRDFPNALTSPYFLCAARMR